MNENYIDDDKYSYPESCSSVSLFVCHAIDSTVFHHTILLNSVGQSPLIESTSLL